MISATLFHFISLFILDTLFIRVEWIKLLLTFINFNSLPLRRSSTLETFLLQVEALRF